MARASFVDVELRVDAVPLLPGAESIAATGLVSSLHAANARARYAVRCGDEVAVSPPFMLLFDPQTSGGLLASVPGPQAPQCLAALHRLA